MPNGLENAGSLADQAIALVITHLSSWKWITLFYMSLCTINLPTHFQTWLSVDQAIKRPAVYLAAILCGSVFRIFLTDFREPLPRTSLDDLFIGMLSQILLRWTLTQVTFDLYPGMAPPVLIEAMSSASQVGSFFIYLLLTANSPDMTSLFRFEGEPVLICSLLSMGWWWIRPTQAIFRLADFLSGRRRSATTERAPRGGGRRRPQRLPMAAYSPINISILGPIGEEIYFRGFLYACLREHVGVPAAIFINAVDFGLWHRSRLFCEQFAIAVDGVLYAGIFELTGSSVLPCIAAHATWNALCYTHANIRESRSRAVRQAEIRTWREADARAGAINEERIRREAEERAQWEAEAGTQTDAERPGANSRGPFVASAKFFIDRLGPGGYETLRRTNRAGSAPL